MSLQFTLSPQYSGTDIRNFIGTLGRVRRARYAKNALDRINTPYGDGRTNLTAYVLTGLHMSPDFVKGLPTLWQNAQQQVKNLLATDKNLAKDQRRSTFVSAMMELNDPALDEIHQETEAVII